MPVAPFSRAFAIEKSFLNILKRQWSVFPSHLLLETPNANLIKAIQWMNVSYATCFNRKRGKKGHFFQGRFKSILELENPSDNITGGNILRASISQRCIAFDEQMKKTKHINRRMMRIRKKILDN